MENGEQLTFSDESTVASANQGYAFIESGEFGHALMIFDRLLENHPDYPGVEAAYRTSRYWLNRAQSLSSLKPGKESADFLMNQWSEYSQYADEKSFKDCNAYKAAQKYVYYNASEHYKTAFLNQESPTDNYSLLLNLGLCFLTLGDYSRTIETLEYAKSTQKSDPRLISLLAESYFHNGEIPKALLLFREAFFINPSEIDLSVIKSRPVLEVAEIAAHHHPREDVREWIPVYAFVTDVFYVKAKISQHTVELIARDIISLEKSVQQMPQEKLCLTNVLPRLINKYLWLYDYYQSQSYNLDALSRISQKLIEIDRGLFVPYFSTHRK